MKIGQQILLLLMLLFFGVCAGGKKPQVQPLPAFTLKFGKAGGFTNINPVYSINNTGNLLKQTSEKAEPVLLKKLSSDRIDSVYLLIKQTRFLNDNISIRGNISNYIELRQDTLQRKIIWTDNSQLSPDCLELHLYLMKMIKN